MGRIFIRYGENQSKTKRYFNPRRRLTLVKIAYVSFEHSVKHHMKWQMKEWDSPSWIEISIFTKLKKKHEKSTPNRMKQHS